MFHEIKLEFKKNIYVPYIFIEIIGIIILCLSATGETDMNGKQISIFSLIFQELPANTDVLKSALSLWQAGIGGWLVVFAPMLLSMGYILLISEERRNGQIRFHILRSGNWKYCISKLCSGALAGGIVFLIGYALFGLLMLVRFPSIRTFSAEEQEILLMGSSISVVIIKTNWCFFIWHVWKCFRNRCCHCVSGQVHAGMPSIYDQLHIPADINKNGNGCHGGRGI